MTRGGGGGRHPRRRWYAGDLRDRGPPDVAGERGTAQGFAVVVGEHQAVGVRARKLPDVLGKSGYDDLGERDRPVRGHRLGRREEGRLAGKQDQLPVDPDRAAQKVDPVEGRPKISPCRIPVPAAVTTRAR